MPEQRKERKKEEEEKGEKKKEEGGGEASVRERGVGWGGGGRCSPSPQGKTLPVEMFLERE